jgi:hypothetical protein
MPHSLFNIREWDLPKLLLAGAGVFAVAALGFFLAVFLQLHGFTPVYTQQKTIDIPVEEKARAMGVGSGPSTTHVGSTTSPTKSNQADQGDPRAAEKLKIMRSK